MAKARQRHLLGFLAVMGAGAGIVGAFLSWLRVSPGAIAFEGGAVGGRALGYDTLYGRVALVSCAIGFLLAVVWLARGRNRVLGALLLLAGSVATAAAGLTLVALEDAFVSWGAKEASNPGLVPPNVEQLLQGLIANGTVDVSPGLGAYVTLAAGIVTTVMGLLALLLRPDSRALPSDTMPQAESLLEGQSRRQTGASDKTPPDASEWR
jgi:hypothetical protein